MLSIISVINSIDLRDSTARTRDALICPSVWCHSSGVSHKMVVLWCSKSELVVRESFHVHGYLRVDAMVNWQWNGGLLVTIIFKY